MHKSNTFVEIRVSMFEVCSPVFVFKCTPGTTPGISFAQRAWQRQSGARCCMQLRMDPICSKCFHHLHSHYKLSPPFWEKTLLLWHPKWILLDTFGLQYLQSTTMVWDGHLASCIVTSSALVARTLSMQRVHFVRCKAMPRHAYQGLDAIHSAADQSFIEAADDAHLDAYGCFEVQWDSQVSEKCEELKSWASPTVGGARSSHNKLNLPLS